VVSRFVAPIRRKDTAKGHHYVDATGARVPGVTTILGDGVPKPALINWAANTTADAAINRWDELTSLPPAARLKALQAARYEDKDKAAKRGTEVHALAEKLVMGQAVQAPDEIAGHVESYARFLDDFQVKPVHVEFSIASVKWGYAGTGDLIADLLLPSQSSVPEDWRKFLGARIRLLCDAKTTRSGIFGETALQLAAYRYAETLIDGDVDLPMPEVDACAAIHVRGDGYDLIPVTAGEQQHKQFLYAQQVGFFASHSRDLIGAPVVPPTTSTYRLTREQSA
jgi:hypothetical protein